MIVIFGLIYDGLCPLDLYIKRGTDFAWSHRRTSKLNLISLSTKSCRRYCLVGNHSRRLTRHDWSYLQDFKAHWAYHKQFQDLSDGCQPLCSISNNYQQETNWKHQQIQVPWVFLTSHGKAGKDISAQISNALAVFASLKMGLWAGHEILST